MDDTMTSTPSPFRIPTRVLLGAGVLDRLPEVAVGFGGPRWMLVVDPGLAATPWPEKALAALRRAGGGEVRVFDRVEPNPRGTTVEALAEILRREEIGAVVGLGGGSVLDAAKAAAMLATNGGTPVDYEGRNRFSRSPLPFVAIPTTCGTGSEVTWVSVLSVPAAGAPGGGGSGRRAKISVKGDGMFPDFALVDPNLLTTLPPRLVAATGLDALTHALEALTGRLANPASDALATRAVELLCLYLSRAAADPVGDGEAREAVMTASTLAGMAFGNADVGAVHCLSETLGGFYDLPHGVLNAVLLVPVLRAHGASVHAPLAALEGVVLGRLEGGGEAAAAGRGLAALETLVARLDMPSFGSFGVPPEDHPALAAGAVANGSNASNPRPMGEREYLEVLAGLAHPAAGGSGTGPDGS